MNKKQLFAAKARRAADLKAQQDKAAQGPYELSMTFCVDEVNEVIDKYREVNESIYQYQQPEVA